MKDTRSKTPITDRLSFQLGFPFLLFLTILSCVVVLVVVVSYNYDRREAADVPDGIARNARESITGFLNYLHLSLELASKGFDPTRYTNTSVNFLDSVIAENSSSIEGIVFFDSEGVELYRAGFTSEEETSPEVILAEGYFDTVITDGVEYISKPFLGDGGMYKVFWVFPVRDSRGSITGLMRVTVNTAPLNELVSLVSGGDLALVYVFDADNGILATSRAIALSQPEINDVLASLRYTSGVSFYTGILGDRVGGKLELLPPTSWNVVAEVPIETLSARTQQNFILLSIFLGIFVILLLYELYTFRKNLSSPLEQFVKTVRDFGAGNYKARVTVRAQNELSLLARVFNDMAESIDRTTTEIIHKLQTTVGDLDKSARLLIRRDLELSRANEKLRELDQAKSEFVSVAAHQLRTPLSGIKWTLNLLINGDLGPVPDEQKTFLLKSYESNERMIGLINDMLSADRAESGKQKFTFASEQILHIIDSVMFEILPNARKKRINIEFAHRRENLPKVIVDHEKIRAVIQNLLENAVKYTMEGGAVTVSFEEVGGFLKISVSDTGIGIPLAQQGKIFGRFFRGTNAVKVETDGTGLGLFIAKNIVEKHGGKIWFESTEGKGTAFHFTVPIDTKTQQ